MTLIHEKFGAVEDTGKDFASLSAGGTVKVRKNGRLLKGWKEYQYSYLDLVPMKKIEGQSWSEFIMVNKVTGEHVYF